MRVGEQVAWLEPGGSTAGASAGGSVRTDLWLVAMEGWQSRLPEWASDWRQAWGRWSGSLSPLQVDDEED